MNFSNNKKGIQIFLCLLIFLYNSCAESQPMTQDIRNKRLISERDLLQNYETLSRNAVTKDTIISYMRSQKDKYVSINNGQDFDIPIDDNIMNRPIGTYQYIDANGDLHIVNFINDVNGLRILNDYKPYASPESRNKLKNIASNDFKNKNPEQQSKGNNEFSEGRHSVGDESDQNINYDEYEFTFMPQEINKTVDKTNKKLNDLNSDESNKRIDKMSSNEESNKFISNNDNNYQEIHRLTQLMNSMPLPQPFSAALHSQLPLFEQLPKLTNDNWRGPPISQSFTYGLRSQGFTANFGAQQVFNWNTNY